MGLRNLGLLRTYRSLHTDVVSCFYTPALSEAVLYRRAVGFFSSTALALMTDGIKGLLENGGRIELVASPRLSEADLAAINEGLERRDDLVRARLLEDLAEPHGPFEEARLNLLANLVASGALEIKIALLESGDEVGMFHEKFGVISDAAGDSVAFAGSMNESANAFYRNYESIDVYCSWTADSDRVRDKASAFSAMWGDYEPGITVLDFPDVSSAIVERYRVRDGVDLSDLDTMREGPSTPVGEAPGVPDGAPRVPDGVELRPYQTQAILEWTARGYRGVFDMATGTGKTYTALAAAASLSKAVGHCLAIVIVCPYQHLVEQWREDIAAFGMRPVVCHSASNQRNWRDRVKNSVSGFILGGVERFCIVTTNATFSSDFMQQQLSRLRGNCLIVADEAHNLGAEKLSAALPANFPYRLALSATIERHGDEKGTERLVSYFGERCIEYTLEDAINAGMLTPYRYHAIPVPLDPEERAEYASLSRRISRAVASSGAGSSRDMPESVKMLLLRRARIVAGAASKVSALRRELAAHRDENHILIYCGAATVSDIGYREGDPDDAEVRQIDAVSEMLGIELGMRVSQFTSREGADERALLKREFEDGSIQALVAIRCLDEGVNIPSIESAFILASGTNPKEYVQRRGRVLRLSPGKSVAEIYDFVALPVLPGEEDSLGDDELADLKSLPAREIARMREFSRIAENPADTIMLIGSIVEAYGITRRDEEETNA